MEEVFDPDQSYPAQDHHMDDPILPEEEEGSRQSSLIQLNDDLMCSEDGFAIDQGNAVPPADDDGDDLRTPEDGLAPHQFHPAQCHDDSSLQEEDFEFSTPSFLPDKALSTESVSLLHADGHKQRYLAILNSPIDNYIAQKINDGHEFAIGGDPSHILTSLQQEFAFRPQQRWHVIIVPEDNLGLLGVPRQTYALGSGMIDRSFQGVEEAGRSHQNNNYDGSLMSGGPVNPPSHSHDGQGFMYHANGGYNALASPHQNDDFNDVMMNDEPVDLLTIGFGGPGSIEPEQPQQTSNFHDNMTGSRRSAFSSYNNGGEGSSSQPSHNSNQVTSTPIPFAPNDSAWPPVSSETNKQERSRQEAAEHETFTQENEVERHKRKDAAVIEADARLGDYSGTNLCRWCGRRGHEAVQCIKWDPDHLDKAVCVACNNKKHTIDQCKIFRNLSSEDKMKLLLVDGAKRPGVRSYFWSWTFYTHDFHIKFGSFDPSVTAFPMTREFIHRLVCNQPNGAMWSSLWKTFPYGDHELPEQFHNKELVFEGQDETSNAVR